MDRQTSTKMIYLLILVVVVIALYFLYKKNVEQEKISEFGKYRGYIQEMYDGNERRSEYLTLSSGTRLAYDLYLPTKKGVPVDKPLPVLFKYTPYTRAFTIFDKDGQNSIAGLFNLGWKEKAYLRVRYWFGERGHLMDALFRTKYLENMLKHGYAVIVVERPGTGASFGVMNASFEVGAKEVNEILNWIAAQGWCDGNIGMYGDSFQAMIQFAAAATGNPHLKALFPTSSGFDLYSSVSYPGGVYNKTFASFFSWSTSFLEQVPTPVDSDKDGSLLAQARQGRADSTLGKQSEAWFKEFPLHDSITSKAPYNNLGRPYHSHNKSDLAPLPAGEPVELVFNLLPTSYRFHKGSRIRITVAFADADNFDTPVMNPTPKLRLLRDMDHPSSIELPMVQSP